jgi:hypothetical protein
MFFEWLGDDQVHRWFGSFENQTDRHRSLVVASETFEKLKDSEIAKSDE